MAIYIIQRVVVLALMTSLLHSCIDSLVSASFCPERQYLHAKLQACFNCTQCKNGMVVLRPCEFHRDTLCATIEELLETMETGNHHRHKHNRHQHHHQPPDTVNADIVWRFDDDVPKDHPPPISTSAQIETTAQASADLEAVYSGPEAAFSGAETLVWDWQAVALTAAVFTCILFFLVITLYSLHQARQWRRLKENFDADVEELSARLSLMAASSSEKELQEAVTLVSTPASSLASTPDANYLNAKCVYLEQLLSVRKDEDKVGTIPRGNVYIEGTNSNKGP